VFRLWSAEEDPGDIQAIITTFDLFCFEIKESLRISVSFEALKGTWSALSPIALMHYFRAKRLNKINFTFCLFQHLTFFFAYYCFVYLELFNFRLNQRVPIFHSHLNPFSQKFDKSNEILKKYHWLQLSV
jgi:hypothetical protein